VSAESNVEIARRGFDAALRGDLDAIAAILDPDVKWHAGDPDAEGACHNRTEALEFMRAGFERGAVGELVDVVGAGDKVVVILRPQTGGTVANLSTFRDGKVTEMVHYFDPEEALAAAGV
jgi:ketosteroid isomerase-like protein